LNKTEHINLNNLIAIASSEVDLPGATAEVNNIAPLFQSSIILQEEKVDKNKIKQSISSISGQLNVLHFACHSVFNDHVPELSYIALPAHEDKQENLYYHHILSLDLRGVSLVTLAACSSGRIRAMGGDDIVGFIRCFFVAGSSIVLAPIWNIDDEASVEFFTHFYNSLLTGITPSQSLRQAQESLSRTDKWAHPFFWGAFSLWGYSG
jgi:CHAT domain-containing protein